VRLDRRTQLLYDERHLFLNGAAAPWPRAGGVALRRLANERRLAPRSVGALAAAAATFIWQGYRNGFLHLDV